MQLHPRPLARTCFGLDLLVGWLVATAYVVKAEVRWRHVHKTEN